MNYPVKKTIYSIICFSAVWLVVSLLFNQPFNLNDYLWSVGAYSIIFIVITFLFERNEKDKK
ncbi:MULTISPECIES: hypothetical protein [Enterococcus]|uniref:hypothetical protein n=1 Tax=Enterococcus TaxID=1350 RepID=UPI0008A415A9|nr:MULTISPECIES: hypothetical protein [Enterococcus]MCK6018169.1 hypothetical protein [Enterococcus faecium]MCK6056126.1 hypothetical protein [Enterococcus faecium]MCZ9357962.1 hypothetical protein [Enterococcus faecium]OFK96566.1 hypothetical protein HMPREF2793_06345 [Enterococcus sp. HMSC063H10]